MDVIYLHFKRLLTIMIRIIYLVSFLLLVCDMGTYYNEDKIHKLTNGKTINLVAPEKTLIINYWATWCAPCRDEIPELNELAHEISESVVVIGVNYDQVQGEKLTQQMQSLGIKFGNLLNDPRDIWNLEPVTVLPETLIINTKGELIHRMVGPQTKKSLSALVTAD
jgi:thiol-disulfide isomerase/thioredoxin